MKAKLRKPIHPDTFQLVTNYRSHGGIVDCAVSLIELLGQIQLGMSIGRHYFFAVLIEETADRDSIWELIRLSLSAPGLRR